MDLEQPFAVNDKQPTGSAEVLVRLRGVVEKMGWVWMKTAQLAVLVVKVTVREYFLT